MLRPSLRGIIFKKGRPLMCNVTWQTVSSDTGIVRYIIIRDALSHLDTLYILMRTVSEKSTTTFAKAVVSKEMISLKRRITSLPVTRSSRRKI